MAVATESTIVIYEGNESAVTPYPVPFRVDEVSHVKVGSRVNEAIIGETPFTAFAPENYTVNLIPETGLAEVVLVEAYDGSTEIGIWREVPATQAREYPISGPFPAKSHEKALDKLTMLVQQLLARVDRCLELRQNEDQDTPGILPSPSYGLTGFDEDNIGQIFSFTALADLLRPNYIATYVTDTIPTTEDIPDGYARIWVDTSQPADQRVRLWANHDGNFYNVILGDAGA